MVALCALALLLLLAGPVGAQEGSGPSFGDTSVINETAFEIVVESEKDVDEGSIEASDFRLSAGDVDRIDAVSRGNDSVVTVHLTSAITSDNTTVSIANGGAIADAAGNELTDDSATVVGMDGVAPILESFDVTWQNDTTVTVGVTVNEPMDNVSVGVRGRQSDRLGPSDFREVDHLGVNEHRYEANYTFSAEDEYRVTLRWVGDVWGNQNLFYADRTILHDVTAPDARVDGPTTATVGQEVVYDGSGSTDEYGIEEYVWTVDGEPVGNDSSVTYTFDEPGRHEVELRVTDRRNNTDRVRYPVEVLDATTAEDVTITPTNGTGVDVTVGPNRSQRRVLVDRRGGIAGNGTVVLDSLTLSVPTDGTTNLSTGAMTGAPATFDVAEQTPLETLTIDHGGADVTDVTFRFSVRRSALEDANLSVDGVSLYRETGGWTRLPTYRVGGNATHAQYRATSPGLSRFVVAGTGEAIDDGSTGGSTSGEGASDGSDTDGSSTDGTGTDGSTADDGGTDGSTLSIVDGRVLTRNVSAGDHVVARATVENDGNATRTYVAGLTVNASLLRTTEVTIPPGERREVTIAAPVVTDGPVAINGTTLGTVTVGNGPAPAQAAESSGGGLPIPNPLSLWPGGLLGRVLGAIFWLVLIVYGILKGLAIYLGY